MTNPILKTDSYKASQYKQYPPNTSLIYSYGEARIPGKRIVHNGMQPYLKNHLSVRITQEMIDHAEPLWVGHGEPFNRLGWEYIVNKHGGYLPVSVRSAPEGRVIDSQNAVYTVENTDPKCFWLTSYLESTMLRAVWYPSTVATISWEIKQRIIRALELTGNVDEIGFKLHDFGSRGVSSGESAAIGGTAHLINFIGTDTFEAIPYAMENYNMAEMPGFSIPATEHSTITSWGRENEVEAYRNMLQQFGSSGIFACVSDSYDIYAACEHMWGGALRQEVIDSGAVVVIRPDSGDPVEVNRKLLRILDDKFGHTVNNKKFKVLNHVRIIQGDGVNPQSIDAILTMMQAGGWSADNMAFGMGGALLQRLDRDTHAWAQKCSYAEAGGQSIDVYKDPVGDKGKKSKKGRLKLVEVEGQEGLKFVTTGSCSDVEDTMVEVFRNGEILREWDFQQVRENSNIF